METILFVSNSSYSMLFFRQGLLKKFIAEGYEVHVIAPFDYKSKELEQLNCIYHRLDFKTKSLNPFYDLKLIVELFFLYKKIKPKYAFHYTIKPNLYGSFVSYILRIKSLAVVTGLGITFNNISWLNKFVKFLYSFFFKFTTEVWFLNKEDLEEFVSNNLVNKEKAFMLPGEGVNTREFQPAAAEVNNSELAFVMLTRIMWEKGVKEFVEAAIVVKKEFPKVKFRLYGSVDEKCASCIPLSQLEEWKKNGDIEFDGFSYNVKESMSQATCIVLPSFYKEGLSKVLMEAAAMAKPIIASDISGCRELIDDGVNGFIFKPKNTGDLVGSIKKIINLSATEREAMGKAGRDKMIREYEETIIIDYYVSFIAKYKVK